MTAGAEIRRPRRLRKGKREQRYRANLKRPAGRLREIVPTSGLFDRNRSSIQIEDLTAREVVR